HKSTQSYVVVRASVILVYPGLSVHDFKFEDCLKTLVNRGQNKNVEDASDAYRPLDIYETSDSKASENNKSAHEEANGHKRNGMAADNSHDDDDVGDVPADVAPAFLLSSS
ncbi:hypothetical protein Tco_0580227, partial [Tanacetum coccineum]